MSEEELLLHKVLQRVRAFQIMPQCWCCPANVVVMTLSQQHVILQHLNTDSTVDIYTLVYTSHVVLDRLLWSQG